MQLAVRENERQSLEGFVVAEGTEFWIVAGPERLMQLCRSKLGVNLPRTLVVEYSLPYFYIISCEFQVPPF